MRRLILAVVVTLSALGLTAPPTLAFPNTIQVTTTADGEFPGDGKCSLAAAIKASNTSGAAGYCVKPGTAETDIIRFTVGSGLQTITLAADLPAITAPVTIDGGGPKVRITGSGALTTGLEIQATGTTVRDMVIDGFVTGIHVSGTAGADLFGNIVGPNSDAGILVNNSNTDVTIGSNIGTTPSTACAGDCNLIKGNGRVGVEAYGGGEIMGNFIGTTVGGKVANANGIGLIIGDGTWKVGTHSTGDLNLISGNTGDGLQLIDCTCTVQNNVIGMTVDGASALGNGGDGIDIDRSESTLIGGPGFGTGNYISGNGSNGINVDTDERHVGAVLSIFGNSIGIARSGSALPNAGDGIYIGELAPATIVGSDIVHHGNRIAQNGGAGVHVVGVNQSDARIQGNSIYKNTGKGIALDSGANSSILPPVVTGSSPVSGTACANCRVDVYSDKADEGKIYHGHATADGSGNWSYPNTVYGPYVTATSTGANGNTSEFSAPMAVGDGGGGGGAGANQPDGRIRKFSGAYIGNNIYNADGNNQTKSGQARIGYIVEFTLLIENDGDEADAFHLGVNAGSTTMYRIKYSRGSNDVTAKVVDGTYLTPTLAPGATLAITIDVIVKKGATLGSSVSRLVTITSVGDNSKQDAIGFVGARR
ncbi:MAG: large repetitive protein [Chloroflexota bacterium]|nr:large repetitive protein [Chloroflexota bacterium]